MEITELYNDNEPISIDSYFSKCGVKDVAKYMNPNGSYVEDPMIYRNMGEAIQLIKYHVLMNDKIYILFDADVDGYTSGIIMYQYLKMLNENLDLTILLHNDKTRGLNDDILYDRILSEKPNLLIIPDSNTNEKERTRKVFENGTNVLVIDHHDIQTPIDCGVLITNQFDDETDYNGSGCLVTHKVLQQLDKEFNVHYSHYFVDMVALSIISDSMNTTSMQNREYLNFGILNADCIKNPFLQTLFDKFIGAKDVYTNHQISFSIVPKLNAVIRTTDLQLKQRLVLALLNQDNLDEVAELCAQAHSNQINTVNTIVEQSKDLLNKNDNILFLSSDIIPKNYSGLIAGKISGDYKKPALVGSVKDGLFIGSMRSPIPLRTELASNDLVEDMKGHEYACGAFIKEENIQLLIDYYNGVVFNYTPNIKVLKSYTIKSIPNKLFGLFDDLDEFWSNDLPKPMFHIKNIKFNPKDVCIIGKNKRTLKMNIEGIDILIFNSLKEDKENLLLGYYEDGAFVSEPKNKTMNMECIGYLGVNVWNGKITPQIIIDKYEIRENDKKTIDNIF